MSIVEDVAENPDYDYYNGYHYYIYGGSPATTNGDPYYDKLHLYLYGTDVDIPQ